MSRNPTLKRLEYQQMRQFIKMAIGGDEDLASKIAFAMEHELTPRQRELATMYYIQQIKMEDMSEILGISAGSISRTLKRARVRLYRCLKFGGTTLLSALDDRIS